MLRLGLSQEYKDLSIYANQSILYSIVKKGRRKNI